MAAGNTQILVIEDDPDCAEAIAEVLADGGFSAHVVLDCTEAISRIGGNGAIGVLVLDLHLPEMDGLALLSALREAAGARGRSLQALLSSGDASVGDLDNAMRLGISAFLPKPIDRVSLLNGVTDALNRYRDLERDREMRDGLVSRFRAIEDGLAAAARDMAGMVALSVGHAERDAVPLPSGGVGQAWDGVHCSRLLREARLMDRLFERHGIDHIDWRILLALYEAHLGGNDASATNIALACGASATAGLRHIAALEERGLIERDADPADARRVRLGMSREARELCREAMQAIMALRSGA